MTLISAILKKVRSTEKCTSPPPDVESIVFPKKKKLVDKYAHVQTKVDTSPPRHDPSYKIKKLEAWRRHMEDIHAANIRLLLNIKRTHFTRGKVDSRWTDLPSGNKQYYKNRKQFLEQIHDENKTVHKRIMTTKSKVQPTYSLHKDWTRNRREMIHVAQNKFVLFDPIPQQDMEDPAFAAPHGVKRPRIYMKLRHHEGAEIGELQAELFTDVCPLTCQLFIDLLDRDGLGHGYVGTHFFRKVPHLFWSGGDVIYNNGFGCYAQRGRVRPIGAENYHFSHSMPGLLSMRMTRDDEMCGIFNITFKPLPQFDLKNVVFGRIIRPSSTYNGIVEIGSALSTRPVIEISSTRRREGRRWVYGTPNTVLKSRPRILRCRN